MKSSEMDFHEGAILENNQDEGRKKRRQFNSATYTWEEDLKIYTFWVMEILLLKKKDFTDLANQLHRTPTAIKGRMHNLRNLTPELVVKFRAIAKGSEREYKLENKNDNIFRLVKVSSKAEQTKKRLKHLRRRSESNLKKRDKTDRVEFDQSVFKDPLANSPEKVPPQPTIAQDPEFGNVADPELSDEDSLNGFIDEPSP